VLGEHVDEHAPLAGPRRVDEVHALLVEVLVADRDAALEAQGRPRDPPPERPWHQRSEQAPCVAQLGERGLEQRIVRRGCHGGYHARGRDASA
jgi:hypothetical protein